MKPSVNPVNPVMLVDDEEHFLTSATFALSAGGINNLITISDSRKAMDVMDKSAISVIVLDMMMPYKSGAELLDEILEKYPQIPVIMLTAVNDVETAVNCIRKGAYDYIVKPVTNDRLVTAVRNALEVNIIREENRNLKEIVLESGKTPVKRFEGIITENSKMLSIFRYIDAIAKTPFPVLITGETGTGKESIAKAIHESSGLKGEFIAVDIAGVDDNLFSDTLFGHRKGAFTGADSERKGLIEKAAGGTLFLDEIGDLAMESQVKLLRLIQEKKYFQLGSDFPKLSSARIITATHKDLREMQKSGKFRTDLFYRLQSHNIQLPPLRDRTDDIEQLLTHFIACAAKECGKKQITFPRELVTLLKNYSFPGNIRELQGMVYDAVTVHKKGVLSLESFKEKINMEIPYSDEISENVTFGSSLPTLNSMEDALIDEALKRANGNQTIASGMLGISRQALNKKLSRRNS